MPAVRVLLRPTAEINEFDLFDACLQVVPAGFNSPQGRLTPGSIEFNAHRVKLDDYLTVDVFIDIEAFHYGDRQDVDDRCEAIKAALKLLFPKATFAVWGKLVKAGWASDSDDPEFDGDLSMPAAIERTRAAFAERFAIPY